MRFIRRLDRRALAACCVLAACCILTPSCKSSGDDTGSAGNSATGNTSGTAATSQPEATPKKPKKPSMRPKLAPWRPLIAEAGRAELDVDGLLIDFGTADQHKFTRGGWRTGWGESRVDDNVSLTEVPGKKTTLDVLGHSAVAEVVVRARSALSGQKITLYVDDKAIGSAPVGSDWGLARIPMAKPVEPGRHTVMLRYAKSQPKGPSAEIDWLWMAGEAGAEPPEGAGVRVLPIRVGGQPKRALIAPTSRSYSFYMQLPKSASLVIDHGSEVGAVFTVWVHTDDGESKKVFSGESEKEWTEEVIDLGAWADKAVRLELATTGKGGVSGWAEPAIMVAPESVAKKSAAGRGKTPKNVMVILIDTVRDDVFKPHNPDSQVKTPAYNAFAEKSAVFLEAYNNENWTKPSVATTLSSLYPTTHDTKKDGSALPAEVELISQHLQKAGFSTAGFVANGYVSKKFGFEKGWDSFRNYIRENRNSDAEFVYRDALEWLNEGRDKTKPFFLYIQTIDPHVVYRVAREYTSLYFKGDYKGPLGPDIAAEEQRALSSNKMKVSSRDIDWLRAVYYGEVTYHDEHMGKFLEQFETLGFMDDTLIVVTNDHGEELQDHGKFGHGHSLYEDMIRAPLLMYYPPRFAPGSQIEEIVENVDVVPTILEVLGQEPMKDAEGQSLLPLVEGNPGTRPYYAISEFLEGRRSVRVGRWKFMRSSSTWIHLYDVVDDVKETRNHAGKAEIAQRMCEVHLGEGLAVPDKSKRLQNIAVRRKLKAGQADISPEMRRQLEALGYFGDDNKDTEDVPDDSE